MEERGGRGGSLANPRIQLQVVICCAVGRADGSGCSKFVTKATASKVQIDPRAVTTTPFTCTS